MTFRESHMVSDWRLYYAKANYLTINPLLFTSFFTWCSGRWTLTLAVFQLFNDLTRAQHYLYSIVPFPYACSLLSFNHLIVLSSSSMNWYLPSSFSSLSLVFISLQSRVVHFPYSFGDIRSPVHPFPFSLCHSCLAFLILSSSHESCIVSCSRHSLIYVAAISFYL